MSAELSVKDIKLAMYEVTFRVTVRPTEKYRDHSTTAHICVRGDGNEGREVDITEIGVFPLSGSVIRERVVTLDGAYGEAVRAAWRIIFGRYTPAADYLTFVGLTTLKIERLYGDLTLCPVAAKSLREARE